MFAARYEPPLAKNTTNPDFSKKFEEKLGKLKQSKVKNEDFMEEDTEYKQDNNVTMNDVKEQERLKRKREDLDSGSESEGDSSESESEDLSIDSEFDVAGEDARPYKDIKIEDAGIDEEFNKAHSSILSRFKKVMNKQSELTVNNENVKEETAERKDVAPLPQLKLPRDKQLYSQIHKNQNLDWLTKPAFYDSNLTKPFGEFDPSIHPLLLKNLQNEFGIKNAFSVQLTLIQELLKDIKRGKFDPTPRGDYLINAATGSGKTLSYLIPIMQYILGDKTQLRIKDCGIKAIIIVPTKPLVQQVYSDVLKLAKGSDLNIMALKSGGDVSISEEKNKIHSNLIDLLIATPGRLVEHLDNINARSLRFLVVDEADRLLNQNFQDWCDLVMSKIETLNTTDLTFRLRCIKIILSATLTTNSEKLTHLRLFKPRLVIVNTENTNELYQLPRTLDEKLIKVSEKLSYFKPLILAKFFQWIDKSDNRYDNFGMVFTKSNESTIRLNKLLNEIVTKFGLNIRINCINSMMKNQERLKLLKDFDANGGILICTDLLSRGINLTSIKFVVNYELPGSTKEYIHRIGRTARAGNFGNAVSFCYGENEFKWFKKIVYSGQQINRNEKAITDVKFVKNKEEIEEFKDIEDVLEVNLSDYEKQLYEECLKVL